MSTFINMLVCARPEPLEKAAAAALDAMRYRPELSQALVRQPLGDGFFAVLYFVGPEVETRSEMLGVAFELFDEEEGEGWLRKVSARVPQETFFALVYTDMFQFKKAWKLTGARWQSYAMISDHGERASSDGDSDGGTLIPDLSKFPDEASNLAEQERLQRRWNPMAFLSAETGLSFETLVGAGYDDENSVVVWRHIGRSGPASPFATWLDELGQLEPPSWRTLVAEVIKDAPSELSALASSAQLAKGSREADAAGERILERVRAAGHVAPAKGPRRTSRVADGLFETSGKIAKLAIVRAPAAVAETLPLFDEIMAIALGELPPEPTEEDGMLALLGVVAHGHTMACCGRTPPEAAASHEREWIGTLVRILPPGLARFGAFAAIAAGAGELIDPAADPFVRSLADAIKRGAPADGMRGVFVDFVRSFPARLAKRELGWFELLCAARGYFVHLERRPLAHVAQLLHELAVDFLAHGTELPGGVISVPPPPATPRPRRSPMAERPAGFLKRLFGKAEAANTWRMELRSVHGLWGGLDLWMFSDGDVWAEEVDRGATVARLYRGELTPQELEQLSALLVERDPRRMQIPPRPGVGGEATTTLVVVTPRGTSSVSKWANDKHADFDGFVARLRSIADGVIQSNAPIWRGPFDATWSP